MDSSEDVRSFALEKCPLGVVVYEAPARIAFRNAAAARFLERHALPGDVATVVHSLFRAIADGSLAEKFPGQVCFSRAVGQPPRRWTFRLERRDGGDPLVCLYLAELTPSSGVDLNAVRQEFRLTRRELDLVRLVLDGRTNLEISAELGIGGQTVKDHLSNVYRKLGVRNRVALLRLLLSPAGADPLSRPK